jgi:DNA-binding NarL/FixJ family response regulator
MRRTTISGRVSSPTPATESNIAPTASSAPAEKPTQSRKRKPRVPLVLIDPAPLTRQSIAVLFARALPEYVIMTAANIDELLRTGSQAFCPALVVINTKSAPVSDPWVQATLDNVKQHLLEAPVVVLLSDRDDVEDVMNALSNGIRGYINPSVKPEVVFAALKLVHAGGTFFPAQAIRTAAAKVHNSSGCTRQQVMTVLDLTPRELSVLELLREGAPNKLIAAALQMQESTVKVHVRNIMKKLHVSNRTHAASVANRLLSQPSPTVADDSPPLLPSNGAAGLLTAHAEAPG